MRAPALALTLTLTAALSFGFLATGLSPAQAQLSGGLGRANAANQSFQQQNQLRGIQQQQTFNANQSRLQNSTNSMNAAAGSYGGPGGYVAPRGRRIARPERER